MPQPSYVTKGFRMVNDVKPGGAFMINCQWTPEELEHHLNAEAKRYIANNDIKLYTINAIDLAAEIGMGKRTNHPAVGVLHAGQRDPAGRGCSTKDAATKSYMKKGQDAVDMNHRAIDGAPRRSCRWRCLQAGRTLWTRTRLRRSRVVPKW
ncbi:MAG: 2-oxoacid:acceptor oxidoreductase family protein [Eggerthellaceae bacterium]